MCGIVGFINAENHTKFGDQCRLIFEQLLWHDTQRGPDGTGVVSINGVKDRLEATMYKNAMWAPEFLGYHSYRNIVQKRLDYARAAIGHNRATTRGSVKNENAHPFTHKHITLVHNGWIPQHGQYLPHDVNHEVDSFTMAYNIAEKGEKEGLEYVPFLGVLVWWNDQDKTLNMARNEHRELWCVQVKGHDTMFYASEWQMLHWILARNGLEPDSKYKLLSPWHQFKFDVMKPSEWTRIPFEKPVSQNNQASNTRGTAAQGQTGAGTGGQIGTALGSTGSKEDSSLLGGSKRPDQISEHELALRERQFSRFTAKQKGKWSIPDSRHKLRKVCAKIHNAFGGSAYFGQRVVIYPDAWAPYKNQRKLGCIMGSKRAEADVKVELPNTSADDYEAMKRDKWMFGTVVNVKKSKTGKWILVCALIPLAAFNEHNEAKGDEEEDKNVVLLKGPAGSKLTVAEFQAKTQQGCGNCSSFVNPNHAADMEWFGEEPICHICAADEQVASALGFKTRLAISVH